MLQIIYVDVQTYRFICEKKSLCFNMGYQRETNKY